MNDTNQLALGEILACEAIQRTASHNQEFVDDALDVIRMAASTGVPFTSDGIWVFMLPGKCTDPRAMGAAFRKAQKDGLIEADGWEKCTRASRHGAPIRRWRAKK